MATLQRMVPETKLERALNAFLDPSLAERRDELWRAASRLQNTLTNTNVRSPEQSQALAAKIARVNVVLQKLSMAPLQVTEPILETCAAELQTIQ